MMATKKTSETSQADVGGKAATDSGANLTPLSVATAEVPQPTMPEPIFATDDEGQHRPMSGGSFIRLEDGTLIRSTEA